MKRRLYSLFHKVNGRWRRQTGLAYRKATAIQVFQNQLLAGATKGVEVSIRPVQACYCQHELAQAAGGHSYDVHDCCALLDKRAQQIPAGWDKVETSHD